MNDGVFPEPLGPNNPKISPALIEKETSVTAEQAGCLTSPTSNFFQEISLLIPQRVTQSYKRLLMVLH